MKISPVTAVAFWYFLVALADTSVAYAQTGVSSVNHVVIAWLKRSGDESARQQFIDVTKEFSKLPGVISVRAGSVLASERAIVDSSFDVAAVITFKDQASLNRYLQHPDHKRAVDEVLNPLVDRVIVYDFISD